MKKLFLVFLISFTLFNSGCDNGFDIISGYEEQLVVFLVLDNRYDKQIINVQKLQNSRGVTTLEKLVDPVSVRIVHPLGYSITFKDTVINTASNYNTLYIDSLDLTEGVYKLFVNARDSLYAWSNITVGPSIRVSISQTDTTFSVYLNATRSVRGASIKPYLPYTLRQNSEFIEKSIELPRALYINKNDTVEVFSRCVQIDGTTSSHSELPYSSVLYMRDKLINYFGAENVRFHNMVKFVAYGYDWSLYEYINLQEGYSDDFSVRLDKPNYTNIVGGMGIFGAVLVDSAIATIYIN
jgi:hypothetical protein